MKNLFSREPRRGILPLLAAAFVAITAGASSCRADLAAELATGDTPQMRGLGMVCHWGRLPNWDIDTGLPLLRQMGVEYVRVEPSWGEIEKTKGVYAMPPITQHWWDAMLGSGLKTFAILDYGNSIYSNPLDPDAFANYAAWMAKTYKGKVAAWEIWNEPDNFEFLKHYGGDRDGRNDALWVAKFSELVRKATAAIKKADPDAVVVQNIEGAAWGMALKNHASDYAQTDGVDVHPYPHGYPAESTPYSDKPNNGVLAITDASHSLASVLDFNANIFPSRWLGHPVQCWVGECGFTTTTPKNDHDTQSVTEEEQAAYEVRSLLIGLVNGVKAWCIYDFICESADPTDGESNYGIVRDVTKNHEPKPAYYALQRLAKLLGPDWKWLPNVNATLDVQVTQPPNADPHVGVNGPEMEWFQVGKSKHQVTIVWKAGYNPGSPARGIIAWPSAPAGLTAEAIDLVTGKNVDVNLKHTVEGPVLYNVPVGDSPVAIRWTLP